jgi:hypothetical protein
MIPQLIIIGGGGGSGGQPQTEDRGLDREEINSFPTSTFKKEPQRASRAGRGSSAQAGEQ